MEGKVARFKAKNKIVNVNVNKNIISFNTSEFIPIDKEYDLTIYEMSTFKRNKLSLIQKMLGYPRVTEVIIKTTFHDGRMFSISYEDLHNIVELPMTFLVRNHIHTVHVNKEGMASFSAYELD